MTKRKSYDMVDRYLRNNMDDDAYAEYSTALDDACGFNEAAQPAQMPAGYVLVPVEPTEAMRFAAEMSSPRGYTDLYKAMVAAAPADTSQKEQSDV